MKSCGMRHTSAIETSSPTQYSPADFETWVSNTVSPFSMYSAAHLALSIPPASSLFKTERF